MSNQETNPSPTQKWEQTLVDDYYNYRWRQVMDPLCDQLQNWKAGQLSHQEMDNVMTKVQADIWEIRNIFGQRRDRLVNLVQWLDREWFLEWIIEYAPPPGAPVLPHPPEET